MVTDPDHVRDKKAEKAAVLLALAADPEKIAGPCLSAEEMATLIDGRITAPASAAYLAHLGSCGKCYEEWLCLKKGINQAAPRGRLYSLHRFKKFSYIGSALAVAASIAVYLNVGNMADKALEKAVPGTALLQDRAAEPVKNGHIIEKIEKKHSSPANGQNAAGSSAMPAAPAGIQEQAQSRPAPVPAPPAGGEQFREQRAKRVAVPQSAQGLVQPEGLAAKEADSASTATPGDADMAGWLVQLGEACRADRHGAEYWARMIDRGERLRLAGTTAPVDQQRPRITALLALLRGMSDPASETRQCRLILAELAKDGETQQ